jgi:hypothetical protein
VGETLPADDLPVEVLPEQEPVANEEAYPVEVLSEDRREDEGSAWPLVLVGLLAVAALAFLLLRGRRRPRRTFVADEVVADYEEVAVPAAPVREPEPVVLQPGPVPPPEVIPLGIGGEAARPWLDLDLHPVRAGVTSGEARVEFLLDVRNQGSAPARAVRISTFMLPAEGKAPRFPADLPETEIDAGSGKRIESSVELPTATLSVESILPVVVAEARYRLPDGSEARTIASFAVGLPDGEGLARFAVDEPSGLHEGVEARPLGEAERA